MNLLFAILLGILLGITLFVVIVVTLAIIAGGTLEKPPDEAPLEINYAKGYVRIICPACSTVSDPYPLDHDFRRSDLPCRCGNRRIDAPVADD